MRSPTATKIHCQAWKKTQQLEVRAPYFSVHEDIRSFNKPHEHRTSTSMLHSIIFVMKYKHSKSTTTCPLKCFKCLKRPPQMRNWPGFSWHLEVWQEDWGAQCKQHRGAVERGFTRKCARLQSPDTLCCLTLLNDGEKPLWADWPVGMQATGTPQSRRALPQDTMPGASPAASEAGLRLCLSPWTHSWRAGKLLRAFLIMKSKVGRL